MTGEERGGEVWVTHFVKSQEVGYTDGSRMEGAATGATAEAGVFLGDLATVMCSNEASGES